MKLILTVVGVFLSSLPARADHKPMPEFERIVIDDDLPEAYQVEVADVDGDGKPDIVALGGGTVAWYQNPTWTRRIITGPDVAPGVISTATRDLDGDGKAELAVAYDFEMNEPTRGELLLAMPGKTIDDPWTTRHLGHFGSIHRVRWGDLDNDGQVDLVVAPIFGEKSRPPTYDQDTAKLVALRTTQPIARAADWTWERIPLAERPVIHAIELMPGTPAPLPGVEAGKSLLLTADNLGVGAVSHDPEMALEDSRLIVGSLYPGTPGPPPDRGSSEVHAGRLAPGSFGPGVSGSFVATVEPWHGRRVVVWRQGADPKSPIQTVIDDTLDSGHALWVVDVDGDGDDEIFAGHRGKDHCVSVYNFNGETWDRTVLDREIAAQDLRGGDLDGDGTPDVVAVGGSTHNVIWYRPVRR